MPPKTQLSQREAKIFDFIRAYCAEHSYSPTIRECGEAVSVSSTSLVNYYLDRLQEFGMIRRDRHVSRSIVVMQ